ncbi:MAG: hypothetical protein H5T64_09610 [Chloroflexi bacterium]|nr:hypothetical protein [Chloroflexota bacterium]
MLNAKDILTQQELYKDLLREAERERLCRQVARRKGEGDRFYCQVLIWLGRRLVAWGWYLQERYGAVTEKPVTLVAHRVR